MSNTQTWPGLLVRASLGDTGRLPRPTITQSPDIPISGPVPFDRPGFLEDADTYDNTYNYEVEAGFPNYAYVRGKNLTNQQIDGHWNLFFAQPNLLLYPYLWENNQLVTGDGNLNPPFSIQPGQVGATQDAFNWVPPGGIDRFSMIAMAITKEHGNPFEGVHAISNLVEVLAKNGNVGMRNVEIVRGIVPEITSSIRYEQGSEAARVDIMAVCRNIPKGSSFFISSSTPLNGRTLSFSIESTGATDFRAGFIDLDIPANWSTTFNYTLKLGSDYSGIPNGAIPSVQLRAELVMDSGHALYDLGAAAEPDPATQAVRTCAKGTPLRVVAAGGFDTVCADMGP